MPKCVRCHTDTQLYENALPVCVSCANKETQPKRKPPSTEVLHGAQLRDTLFRDLVTATTRVNAYQRVLDRVIGQFPDQPLRHAVQEASQDLDAARKDLNGAHNRLNDFLSRGIIPEDLKRAVGQ